MVKYSKGIPYKVVQGSGDANALGVLKFNFPNKYAVYLHDTNQRSLFGVPVRTLSHGCVRVQEWQKLAPVLVRVQRMTIREPEQGQEVLKLQVVLAPAHTQVVEREDHTPLELEPELAEE